MNILYARNVNKNILKYRDLSKKMICTECNSKMFWDREGYGTHICSCGITGRDLTKNYIKYHKRVKRLEK